MQLYLNKTTGAGNQLCFLSVILLLYNSSINIKLIDLHFRHFLCSFALPSRIVSKSKQNQACVFLFVCF